MKRRLLYLLTPLLGLAVGCSGDIGDPDGSDSVGGPGTGTGSAGLPGGGPGGDGLALEGQPIHSRFVRLTHEQWEQSVRDLLKLAAVPGLSSGFTGDPPGGTFSNNERKLFVTSPLWGDYQRAAETLSQQVTHDAASLARITGGATAAPAFIKAFGRRAFRRPLTPAEETRYQAQFAAGATIFKSGNTFTDGAQLVIESMLQSPHFLYRSELGTDGQPLTPYEVASKLSFLLRNTMPDDALLTAADGGELNTAEGVLARAQAMLDAMPASAVFQRFHAELFGLDRYRAIEKDATAFPMYSPSVTADLLQADTLFFDAIFSQGQGFREILQSPVAFVNQATAPFYGLSAQGTAFKQVQLGPDRPGFFTRTGFLTLNATLRDPDIIHRGVDINRRVLGAPSLSPPAGVVIPALPTPKPGQTNRERVSAHTGKGTCGESCHGVYINPIGFAFENFDAMGQPRTTDNGKPIDTTSEYDFTDGTKAFAGAPELMQLMADEGQTHGSYAGHLAEFTLARDVDESDRTFVRGLQQTSMTPSSSIKQIVLSVIESPAFRTRGTP
jgi:Protein of unknown function (DUF1592)/Protein of unknown function (DUF1588)/Protein of unknown function (DUF1595)/Protein of unknown function (DUF1587)/Protein of unknown function (DUF1585)